MQIARPTTARIITLLLCATLLSAGCDLVDAPAPNTTDPAASVAPTATPAITVVEIPPAPTLFEQGLTARTIGDDEAAGDAFSRLVQAYPDAAEARPARFYLAESFARRGRWTSAAALLRELVADAPAADALRGPALFWLARAHENAGDHAAAIDAYERYRALETPAAAYAALRAAAQRRALGDPAGAAADYETAAASAIVRGERAGAYEKAAALRIELGEPEVALELYRALLDLAEEPAYRARILAEAAAIAENAGQADQARIWRMELINVAPASIQALNAADAFVAAGDTGVPAEAIARVYLAAERWDAAEVWLNTAAAQAGDPEQALELRRLRGLALRAQGDFAAAINQLAAVVAGAPDSEPGRQARLDEIQTIGQSGEVPAAADAYVAYAARYVDDPRAPEALDRAAQLQERLGNTARALELRLELAARYPRSDQGLANGNRAGFALFNQGQYAAAADTWAALALANSGAERARNAYWAAQATRNAGDTTRTEELLLVAFEADSSSYEGARAAEILGLAPQGALPIGAPIEPADWTALEDWVATWDTTEDDGSGVAMRIQRAVELAQVGLQVEATAEWREAITLNEQNPRRLATLARAATEADVPYAALLAAARLQRLAPDTAPEAPPILQRLLFPTPYPELVMRESATYGIDPRMLYALMRQESLFNPGATSWVGARGLAQVMPATGEGIAQNLGMAEFTLDDLYRPQISIRFGAFYISRRISDMEGSLPGALAAYNGGLGNALRWAGGSNVADPDAFVETIDFPETRGYVRAVYGFYRVYQELYGQAP
jgi:soluble lytic murein transglycosylase